MKDRCENERKEALRRSIKRDRGRFVKGHRHSPETRRKWSQKRRTFIAPPGWDELVLAAHPEEKKYIEAQRRMWRLYKLTAHDYALLWERQGGRCVLCQRELKEVSAIHIDHNHKTGEVRGLLDGFCNHRFLGPFERGGLTRAVNAMRYLGWA